MQMLNWIDFSLGIFVGAILTILITVIVVVLRSIRRDENGKK